MIGRGLPRLRWILGVGALVALVVACPLLAADISGSWEIAYWTGQTRQVIALELLQEGSRMSGVATLRAAGTDSVIRGQVEGDATRSGDFRFLLFEEDGSLSRSQEFIGRWYRDEMSGRTSGPFGDAIFAGVRRRVPK